MKMADSSLQSIIDDWSSHVFGLAQMYNIKLDYSEKSVEKVEQLCEIIYRQIISNKNIKEENIDKVSRIIGSYLGELIIKNIGGEWTINAEKLLAVRLNCFECYPIIKVYKRVMNGNEDNIEFYYKVCKSQMLQQG